MNTQTQLQYKIHEILSKKGFYRLSLSQLLNVLLLLDMPEQREAKLIQRNTIIGLLKLTQKNKLKLENYFLDQKYRSIPTDIQIFVSTIVWDVIDISSASQENTIAKQQIVEKSVYPFNPFNYMSYSPSLTYGQMPPPNSRINYPASYMPYPNHQMYYYQMFGRLPPSPAIEGKQIINMQMLNNNDYLIPQQPQNDRMMQERQQQNKKNENKLNKIEDKVAKKEEKKQKKPERTKKAKQQNTLLQNSQKIGEQIKKDQKSKRKNQKKIKQRLRQKPKQGQGENRVQEVVQPKPQRKLRRKEQELKEAIPNDVPNIQKNDVQKDVNQEKNPQTKDPKPRKNLKLKKILDKILGSNSQNKQQIPELNKQEVLVPQEMQLQRRQKQRQQEQQMIRQLKRIEEQKLLTRQKGCIDFFQIIKDHRKNRMLQSQNEYEKRGNNMQQEVSLPELQLIYYNSISDFDYKTFPRQYSPQKNILNSKKCSVSIQTDLNLITHRIKIKRKDSQLKEINYQQSFSQELSSSDIDIINSQASKEQKQSILSKKSHQNSFLQNDVQQNQQLCSIPPIISEESSMKAEGAFNVEQLLGAGQAHFQDMQLEDGMILIQPVKPSPNISLLNNCLCKGTIVNSPWISCLICQEKYHCQCLHIQQETANFFQCPRCKIRLIDPFIKPAKILGEFFASDLDKNTFKATFDLSEFNDFMPAKNIERPNELQLRCIQIDYNNDQRTEISWPDESIVKINGLQIAKFYSLLKTSTLKRRKDASIIITSSIHNFIDHDYEDYTKISLQIQARILPEQQFIKKRILNKGTYLIGAYYTKREKVQDLYNKFSSQIQSCNSDFVQSLMELSGGDDLSLQKQVFRIQDPYTGQVMKFPVRGTLCRHAQCFDLRTYLTFMSGLKVRPWRCPICSREAKKFILDHWIFELIQRVTLVNAIPYEIVFMKEGNIILKVNKEKEDQSDETPPEVKTKKIKKNRTQIKRQVTQGDGIKIFKR